MSWPSRSAMRRMARARVRGIAPPDISSAEEPALFAPDRAFAQVFELLHELGAWALLALIGLHAVAAIFHALILRDGVLQRMLPWTVR